ncbi:RNA polymerase sigma factor [Novipirellula sp.]|uniref:RNA polymerase sigma factor n=1 Tax=Novipirellula sp. TaxID=2795430 RepID=UPI0035613326
MKKSTLVNPVTVVPPLRSRTMKNDEPYVRRPDIEDLLQRLLSTDIEEVARRASIFDQDDPEYLPPEVLVHYLRRLKNEDGSEAYRQIFMSVRQHFLQRLKVNRWHDSGGRVIEDRFQAEVRDRVMDRAMEILCGDRMEYDSRLDYYEVNFNGAVARARSTAKRDLCEQEKTENSRSLDAAMNSDDAAEVDAALRSLQGESENFSDVIYRSEVLSAINSLPIEEREVMLMLVEGYKIKEIAEKVGCTPKTASERRNRARAKLAAELNVETKS